MEAGWVPCGCTVPQITVQELSRQRSQNLQVLDVRREPEWQAGHIEGAEWFPLDNFKISAPELDPSAPVAVHCQGGYRSMIACSLLQRAGIENVMNVIGGFDAWRQAGLPVEVPVAESVVITARLPARFAQYESNSCTLTAIP